MPFYVKKIFLLQFLDGLAGPASLFSEMELSLLGSFVPRAGVGALHSSADEHFRGKGISSRKSSLAKSNLEGALFLF